METGVIDVFGAPPRLILYNLFGGEPMTHHDFGSRRPLGVGDSFLMAGDRWVIREVGPPLTPERTATLYCDVGPAYGADVSMIGAE